MKLISFNDAIAEINNEDKTLLLGNGFSIAQNSNFSYSNLLEKSEIQEDCSLLNLFRDFNTVDFELVIHVLEQASKVASAYEKDADRQQYTNDANRVRQHLTNAIRQIHPSSFTEIDQNEIETCVSFLDNFNSIYTLNYDILLYWINLETRKLKDGFGLGKQDGCFHTPFKESAHCNIFNIHGGLHLFLDNERNLQKRISGHFNTLLDSIENAIEHEGKLPLYVAEGSSEQKLNKIRSVPYLNFCYEKLSNLTGNLFCFGHSITENDKHVYDAIFSSKDLTKFYYCVYEIGNWDHIREKLAPFKERNPKIDIRYINAQEMDIWGKCASS